MDGGDGGRDRDQHDSVGIQPRNKPITMMKANRHQADDREPDSQLPVQSAEVTGHSDVNDRRDPAISVSTPVATTTASTLPRVRRCSEKDDLDRSPTDVGVLRLRPHPLSTGRSPGQRALDHFHTGRTDEPRIRGIRSPAEYQDIADDEVGAGIKRRGAVASPCRRGVQRLRAATLLRAFASCRAPMETFSSTSSVTRTAVSGWAATMHTLMRDGQQDGHGSRH